MATGGLPVVGIFADGDNDNFLQSRGSPRLGFFPAARDCHNIESVEGTRFWNNEGVREINNVFTIRCGRATTTPCVLENPSRPWERFLSTLPYGIDATTGSCEGDCPISKPSVASPYERIMRGPEVIELLTSEKWLVAVAFRPPGPRGSLFSIAIGEEGGETRVVATAENPIVASSTATLHQQFVCMGGDCSEPGTVFSLCKMDESRCLQYDPAFGSLEFRSIELDEHSAPLPNGALVILRATADGVIEQLGFYHYDRLCIHFERNDADSIIALDHGCRVVSTMQFLSTTKLSDSDDTRLSLSVSYNLLVQQDRIIVGGMVEGEGVTTVDVLASRSAGSVSLHSTRNTRRTQLPRVDGITKTRIMFGSSLRPVVGARYDASHTGTKCRGPGWVPNRTWVNIDEPTQSWTDIDGYIINVVDATAVFRLATFSSCKRRCEISTGCTAATFDSVTSVCYHVRRPGLLNEIEREGAAKGFVVNSRFSVSS